MLRLTEAELALRAENAGIARGRLQEAADRLRRLAKRVGGAAGKTLQSVASQLQALREATLRLDPRDRTAVDRVAVQLGELRRRVAYLPLGSGAP